MSALEKVRDLLADRPEFKDLAPFAGSGTTLQAAVLQGARAIGIEREPDYIALCQERLRPTERFDLFSG